MRWEPMHQTYFSVISFQKLQILILKMFMQRRIQKKLEKNVQIFANKMSLKSNSEQKWQNKIYEMDF